MNKENPLNDTRFITFVTAIMEGSMNKEGSLRDTQFVKTVIEIACLYDRFLETRKKEDLKEAKECTEQLNHAYKRSIDLLDYVEFGRAWLKNPPRYVC